MRATILAAQCRPVEMKTNLLAAVAGRPAIRMIDDHRRGWFVRFVPEVATASSTVAADATA
jgi:hypothetical protein